MIRPTRLFLPVLLLVLSACGRDDDKETATDSAASGAEAQTDTASAQALYAHVPADTIAVVGNLARAPDDVLDAWWAQIEPLTPMYAQMAEDPDQPEAMRAYFRLLSRLAGREEFEALGLRADLLTVFYFDGLYPYWRLEIGDRETFENTLDEFAADAGFEWQQDMVGDRAYRWTSLPEHENSALKLALAIADDHMAVGLIPLEDQRLEHLVGAAMPQQAIELAEVERFNADHGYTPYGSGWLDVEGLLARLLDADDAAAAAARTAMDIEDIANHPACRAEFSALAAYFPRMLFGIPELRNDYVAMHGRVQTSAALGRQLTSLVDVPMGLGEDAGSLFNFGLGLNIVALRDLARGYVDGWVANPPECPAFEDIAEKADEWQVQLNQPIPPIVTNLQGLRAMVSQFGRDGDAWDVRGVFSLTMNNPQLLIGMAAMFAPELAAMDLRPDGQPQPVPPELFRGMVNTEAFIAMSDTGISLAIGDDQDTRLQESLRPGESDSTLFSYGVDMDAYADFLEQMMTELPDQTGEEAPDIAPMLDTMKDFYQRSFMAVRLTEDGIEFNSASDLEQ